MKDNRKKRRSSWCPIPAISMLEQPRLIADWVLELMPEGRTIQEEKSNQLTNQNLRENLT